MKREIAIGVLSTVITAVAIFVVGSAQGWFDKQLTELQVQRVASEIVVDESRARVLLNRIAQDQDLVDNVARSLAANHRAELSPTVDEVFERLTSGHVSRIQGGRVAVGKGKGVERISVAFPQEFGKAPHVLVTPRGEDYPDTFALATRNISQTGFEINVVASAAGPIDFRVWGQNLELDWLAWE